MVSPLFSNIYLDALDHAMAERASRWCGTRTTSWCYVVRRGESALEGVRQWTAQAGLALHPVKTRIVDATQARGL